MSKELLHTPEGVRDVYGKECARKLTIENKINNICWEICIFCRGCFKDSCDVAVFLCPVAGIWE